jgi:hypothetical protein
VLPLETRLERLFEQLHLDLSLAPVLQAILPFLDLPETAVSATFQTEEGRIQAAMELTADIFASLAKVTGILILIDDLQWLDSKSIDWLKAFIDKRSACGIVLVTRPTADYMDSLEWLSKFKEKSKEDPLSGMVHINLGGLSRDDCATFILHLLNSEKEESLARSVSDDFMNRIFGVTEGIPLFIEQLVLALMDKNALSITNGEVSVLESVASEIFAADLSFLGKAILHQFNKLAPKLQELLKAASVCGQYWTFEEIRAIYKACGMSLQEDTDGQTPEFAIEDLLNLIEAEDRYNFLEVRSNETNEVIEDIGKARQSTVEISSRANVAHKSARSIIGKDQSKTEDAKATSEDSDSHFIFAFRHIVMQSSIYASLLFAERSKIHHALASHYDLSTGNQRQEALVRINHHYCHTEDLVNRFRLADELSVHYVHKMLVRECIKLLASAVEIAASKNVVGTEILSSDLYRVFMFRGTILHNSVFEFEKVMAATETLYKLFGETVPKGTFACIMRILKVVSHHNKTWLNDARKRYRGKLPSADSKVHPAVSAQVHSEAKLASSRLDGLQPGEKAYKTLHESILEKDPEIMRSFLHGAAMV